MIFLIIFLIYSSLVLHKYLSFFLFALKRNVYFDALSTILMISIGSWHIWMFGLFWGGILAILTLSQLLQQSTFMTMIASALIPRSQKGNESQWMLKLEAGPNMLILSCWNWMVLLTALLIIINFFVYPYKSLIYQYDILFDGKERIFWIFVVVIAVVSNCVSLLFFHIENALIDKELGRQGKGS